MAAVSERSDLRQLEREVENARARLHETIAEIRDPRTIEHAKLEMQHRANQMKERAMDYMRERRDEVFDGGRSQIADFSRHLQMTAMKNPMPILMIAAGIGWRLWKRPPVTSALIGTGLWQLMKSWDTTPDSSPYRDPYNRARPRGYVPGGVAGAEDEEIHDVPSAMMAAKVGATDLSYRAQDAVAGVADTLSEATEAVTSRVQDMAGRVQANVQPMLDRAAPLFDEQNRMRLGLLAVAAGAGLFLWRRSEAAQRLVDEARVQADRSVDRARGVAEEIKKGIQSSLPDKMDSRTTQEMAAEHPVLLSLMGLALGTVLGSMIRQMPSAENMMERGADAMERVREAVTGEKPQHEQAQAQRDRVMVHSE